MTLTKLAVVGASGKMGRAVVRLAHDAGISVVSAIAATDVGRDVGELAGIAKTGVLVTNDLDAIASSGAECVIDFSSPALVARVAEVCARANAALVSGTTGLGDAEKNALAAAEKRVPVLWEPNMSIGVFVLSALVKEAVSMLGPGFDIEIVEAHHKLKVDAPSGTAMRLAEVAKKARDERDENAATESAFVFGREGKPGARKASEIGVLAMRGGDVIGDHTVHLIADGERLELTHRASNRDLFAAGALRAGSWITGKKRVDTRSPTCSRVEKI